MKKLALALVLTGFTTACGGPLRAVTHVSTWSTEKGDYLYVGYAENNDTSKVRKCNVNPDNTVTCAEQEEINKLLNAE